MARLTGIVTILAAGANLLAGPTANNGQPSKGDALHPRVKMSTTLGDLVLELNAEKAPVTVMNFIQYAESKYYDGTIFHRVMKGFMIQGGGFTPDLDKKTEGLREGIINEWKNGLKNARGTIAMARMGGQPDSATSQFFINVVDNTPLDVPRDGAGYAVFGKVVEGMDTVDKIRNTEVATNAKYGGGFNKVVPVTPVVIKSVRLVSRFDRDKVKAAIQATAEAHDQAEKQAKEKEKVAIQKLIEKTEKETGHKAVKTDSGLIYFDLKVGDGPMPGKDDHMEVHYTGWLLDGTKFDSSVDRNQPFVFSVENRVIAGWMEGIPTMKVGGKRKLIIPPELAYGDRGRGKIPPNSTLVFDVELLSLK